MNEWLSIDELRDLAGTDARNTPYNWARRWRKEDADQGLVRKSGPNQGAPLEFSPLFVPFLKARLGRRNPGRPSAEAIEETLRQWWRDGEAEDKTTLTWIGLHLLNWKSVKQDIEDYLDARCEYHNIVE